MAKHANLDFPCSLVVKVPFPSNRLASSALRALQVDQELSPLVRRTFSLSTGDSILSETDNASPQDSTVLLVEYHATTNRMLRVAVNGFMESLSLVIEVMKELDTDVLQIPE